jgi:hypothetical protein
MAKGFDSKAVESQIQDSKSSSRDDNKRAPLTAAQIQAHRQREVLRLSRARVAGDLASSSDARYRDQLTRALADLDEQISQLSKN